MRHGTVRSLFLFVNLVRFFWGVVHSSFQGVLCPLFSAFLSSYRTVNRLSSSSSSSSSYSYSCKPQCFVLSSSSCRASSTTLNHPPTHPPSSKTLTHPSTALIYASLPYSTPTTHPPTHSLTQLIKKTHTNALSLVLYCPPPPPPLLLFFPSYSYTATTHLGAFPFLLLLLPLLLLLFKSSAPPPPAAAEEGAQYQEEKRKRKRRRALHPPPPPLPFPPPSSSSHLLLSSRASLAGP